MAEGVWDRDGRYAGNRRLLDRPFADPGELWISGQRGERAAYQDTSGPQDRCVGMPMATEAPHLRTIKQFSGVTGMAILRAIVAGERNTERLAAYKHNRVRASRE